MSDRMFYDSVKRLRREIDASSGLPGSIAFIESSIAQAKMDDEADIGHLYLTLANEFDRAGRPDRAEETLRQYVHECPDSVPALLALSATLKYSADRIDEARSLIATAVAQSQVTNECVRYALGAQARFALQVRDPGLYRATLQALIDDYSQNLSRSNDIGFEADFAMQVPDGFVDGDIVRRYLEMR